MLVFLKQHFLTLFLVFGFSVKLALYRNSKDIQLGYLWMTVFCTLVLIAQNMLRATFGSSPELSFWRTLAAMLGLAVRPVAALGIMMVVGWRSPIRKYLPIPAVVNALAMCTAFFTSWVIRFEGSREIRGPLWYLPFAVAALYAAITLWFIYRYYRRSHVLTRIALYVSTLCCMAAVALDVTLHSSHFNAALITAAIFFFMLLRSQDNMLDALTGLRSRRAWFDDAESFSSRVSAVAAVELTGLKQINEADGIPAGDRALATVARCIRSSTAKETYGYRVGGGKFALLFLSQPEEAVSAQLDRIRSRAEQYGFRVLTGSAVLTGGESVDELYGLACRKVSEEDPV